MGQITDTEKLRVRPGQAISAEHHNGLVSLAEALTLQRGRLRGRQDASGFTAVIRERRTGGPGVVAHALRVQVVEAEPLRVSVEPGHVSGVVPTIDGKALDAVDADGVRPLLEIPRMAWAVQGAGERALVMMRYGLGPDFAVATVVMVAVSEPPAAGPREWYKLVAILTRKDKDGAVAVSQQIFFSQYFDTSERTASGRFRAWPRAAG